MATQIEGKDVHLESYLELCLKNENYKLPVYQSDAQSVQWTALVVGGQALTRDSLC